MNIVRCVLLYLGSGATSRLGGLFLRGISHATLLLPAALCSLARLRTLGTVLAAALLAVFHAIGIQRATHDVIPDARKVLHTTSAHEHNAVLLQAMAFARNVGGDFQTIRQPDTGHFTQRRVRLLGGHGSDLLANAALLGSTLLAAGTLLFIDV